MSTTLRAAVVFLLIEAAGAVWGLSAVPAPAAPAAVALADWDVFAGKGCARCHRVRGLGDGVGGSDLGRLASGTGFFQIAAALWNHLPGMRASVLEQGGEWPQFRPQELANLIGFLFTVQAPEVAGDPAAGSRLFRSRGCAACHADGGAGGGAGPALAELGPSVAPARLTAAMWNHGSQMGEAMRAAGVAPSTLNGTDLRNIVAYVRTVRPGVAGEAPIVVGLAERGRRVFADKGCARCHAAGGIGSGLRLGPRAAGVTIAELAGRMWAHGHTIRLDVLGSGVPVPRLTEHETADLIAHLHASTYFDRAVGDARSGRRLLRDKCLVCHTLNGTGKGTAPDLGRANVVSSQIGQLAAMWNHGRQMENRARRQDTVLPTLGAKELSDITRYLAGLGSIVPPPR